MAATVTNRYNGSKLVGFAAAVLVVVLFDLADRALEETKL
jgi:hypothetical protein